jgi:hypothetical protein
LSPDRVQIESRSSITRVQIESKPSPKPAQSKSKVSPERVQIESNRVRIESESSPNRVRSESKASPNQVHIESNRVLDEYTIIAYSLMQDNLEKGEQKLESPSTSTRIASYLLEGHLSRSRSGTQSQPPSVELKMRKATA